MHHLKELIEIFRLTISSKKCHIFGRLAALRGVKPHVPVRFKGKGAYHRDRNILKATISHITSDYGKSTDPVHRCVLRAHWGGERGEGDAVQLVGHPRSSASGVELSVRLEQETSESAPIVLP